MTRLFHGFRQRNATIGGFGEIARAQAVGGEFCGIQPCHLRALFDDPVDGARFKCASRHIAPAIDFSKHAALVDPGCFQPAGEGFDGSAGQIDGFVLIGTTGLGATEMDAERGRGTALIGDRVCLTSCSMRKPATSLRLRPPEAKATIRIARSRKAVRSSPEQVASSLPRISPVIAFALLRLRGRFRARTASRIADLTEGDENDPSRPRQRVSVDQLARRRRTVAGACGPDTRRKPCRRKSASTSAGMP